MVLFTFLDRLTLFGTVPMDKRDILEQHHHFPSCTWDLSGSRIPLGSRCWYHLVVSSPDSDIDHFSKQNLFSCQKFWVFLDVLPVWNTSMIFQSFDFGFFSRSSVDFYTESEHFHQQTSQLVRGCFPEQLPNISPVTEAKQLAVDSSLESASFRSALWSLLHRLPVVNVLFRQRRLFPLWGLPADLKVFGVLEIYFCHKHFAPGLNLSFVVWNL